MCLCFHLSASFPLGVPKYALHTVQSKKGFVYLPTPNARSIAALALPLLCVRRKPQCHSVLKVAGRQLQWYGYFMREYQGQAFADASDLLQTRRSVCMRRTQWMNRNITDGNFFDFYCTYTCTYTHVHVHVLA